MNLIQELTDYLEQIAPLSLQESYDNSGLLVGNSNWRIQGVLVALDITESVIDEAIELGCNVIVSHHPVIFRGLKQISDQNHLDRGLIKAIKKDIALYAIHTNLDNILVHGVNEKIASRLGLTDIKILKPKLNIEEKIGSGLLGYLPKKLNVSEFLNHVKQSLNTNTIKYTKSFKGEVNKVALCGGSGSFLLQEAMLQGADAFISADFKYHDFFEANDQTIILDIGHFESEQHTIGLIFDLISKKFTNFASHCTKIITNPVQYF
jgi:dinuclear metal center YbgI/SA1388 family protein